MEQWDIRMTDIPVRGGNNIMFTQGLFYEFGNTDAVYTLKGEDVTKGDKTYISLPKVYMESSDEYEAAMRLVGSMQHWRKLCSQAWFLDGIDVHSFEGVKQLREDMVARDKSIAKQQLMAAAHEGNVTAMKTIYGESPTKPVGKPRKGQNNNKQADDITRSIVSDITRIREAQ